MAKPGSRKCKDIKLNIVGSTKFGRYPKMSSEQTFNMIISDGWLVPFAGYKRRLMINPTGQGRSVYSSSPLNKMFCVIDNDIFMFDYSLNYQVVGRLETFVGDVFIAENNASQVAFSDGVNIYIYNGRTGVPAVKAVIDFTPGYLTFQNGRFVSPDTASFKWRLSGLNDGLSWPNDAQHVGTLQTKADKTAACLRFPGKGNLLLVFGSTVVEFWYDLGAQLFPYQRSQSLNIDYGCLNPSTIAYEENIVCWLAGNESSGPAIMYTTGGKPERISNDGIDFKLASLQYPSISYAFMFRQDGHLLYVISWPRDNVSYLYDFNTKMFFTLCDENMNTFVVKKVCFFNDEYFFVSLNDGNLYQLSSEFPLYDYGDGREKEIPCIRVAGSIQMDDQSYFVADYLGFTVEQGQFPFTNSSTDNIARIDMSLSKDGGVNWGSYEAKDMFPQGKRQNRLMWRSLGGSNELVPQLRFWGNRRFVVNDGIIGVRQ